MNNFNFSTSKDIYIEVNGRQLATVKNYKIKKICESNYIESFGEYEPIATIKGKLRYKIYIEQIYLLDDNINFYNLDKFDLVIVKDNKKLIYTGCQWTDMEEFNNNSFIIGNVNIISDGYLETN